MDNLLNPKQNIYNIDRIENDDSVLWKICVENIYYYMEYYVTIKYDKLTNTYSSEFNDNTNIFTFFQNSCFIINLINDIFVEYDDNNFYKIQSTNPEHMLLILGI